METLDSLQNENTNDQIQKLLNQNAELCSYKSISKKLELEIQILYKSKQSKKEECEEQAQEIVVLKDKLEENRQEYEALLKEVDDINLEFDQLQCDKNKTISKLEQCSKKKSDIEYKLMKKTEEVRILKDNNASLKKMFEEKVANLKMDYNKQIIEVSKGIYSNIQDREIFKDPLLNHNAIKVSESYQQDASLKLSHLNHSVSSTKNDISFLKQVETSENITEVLEMFKKYEEKIKLLITENKKLQLLVNKNNMNEKEALLNLKLTKQIELLNDELLFYKKQDQNNQYIEKMVVRDIDQHKELKEYKMLKNISESIQAKILQKRISKLETSLKKYDIEMDERSIQDQENIELQIEKARKEQFTELEGYVKSQLLPMLSQEKDENAEKLGNEICSLKCVNESYKEKVLALQTQKEKLLCSNCDLRSLVKTLEDEITSNK
jgi:chromosome segregation protein